MKIIIDDWEQCVCKSQGLVIIGSTYSIFGLISLLVPCRGHRRYCPLSSAWHVSHVAHVSRHRPQLHLLTLYCTLFTMYNVIYLSDKPRFLKMCVSATVSELLSVICLIWYVPPSEVLLQLWRILRCSSPREILCALLYTCFLLTLFVEDDLVITEFDIYHIFWGGKSYKLPLKVQEKLDYSARSSVLVTNFCSARSLWFWHFRPSLSLPQSRPAANNLHRGGPHIRSLVELETKVNTKVRKIYVMIMIICVDLRFKLYSLGLLCSKQAQLHLEVTGHHFAMLYVWQIQWELTGADGKALITYSLMLGKFCKMFLNQWKNMKEIASAHIHSNNQG